MKSMWQPEASQELLARLSKLRPDSPTQWGKMDCSRMLTHVTDGVRMAIGELQVASKNSPLKLPPIRHMIIYWFPFPKGAPTAPELIERSPGDWEREVTQFKDVLAKLASNSERTDWPEHPAFGKLSAKDWGALIYKHIDHHFKQFGA